MRLGPSLYESNHLIGLAPLISDELPCGPEGHIVEDAVLRVLDCLLVYKEAIEDSEYSILDNVSFWTAGEFIGDERGQADEMIALVEAWPEAHIVIEDFVLRKFTSARELLSPVRITARFDQALHISGDARPMIIQPGVLAMKTVTDARLKRMGLWPPLQGSEHKRDAVRHNITWMKRAKQLFKRNAIADAMSGAKQ